MGDTPCGVTTLRQERRVFMTATAAGGRGSFWQWPGLWSREKPKRRGGLILPGLNTRLSGEGLTAAKKIGRAFTASHNVGKLPEARPAHGPARQDTKGRRPWKCTNPRRPRVGGAELHAEVACS